MSAPEEKFEDYPTGWNTRGGPTLSEWLSSVQEDGWTWDGWEPEMAILPDRTPVLRHRLIR